jgi:hypothetical protein
VSQFTSSDGWRHKTSARTGEIAVELARTNTRSADSAARSLIGRGMPAYLPKSAVNNPHFHGSGRNKYVPCRTGIDRVT